MYRMELGFRRGGREGEWTDQLSEPHIILLLLAAHTLTSRSSHVPCTPGQAPPPSSHPHHTLITSRASHVPCSTRAGPSSRSRFSRLSRAASTCVQHETHALSTCPIFLYITFRSLAAHPLNFYVTSRARPALVCLTCHDIRRRPTHPFRHLPPPHTPGVP